MGDASKVVDSLKHVQAKLVNSSYISMSALSNTIQAIRCNPILSSTPFMTLFTTAYVYHLFGLPFYRWRFPCRTIEDLDGRIGRAEHMIDFNSSPERDFLGQDVEGFRDVLKEVKTKTTEIKNQNKPSPLKLFTWLKFRWHLLFDLDTCYEMLRVMEGEVKVKVYTTRAAAGFKHTNMEDVTGTKDGVVLDYHLRA
ncbi:hypothetical protein VNI00_009152 [Paramarasmius palmivorus]|uniref:Uncharacterized protein n=1 Tax=Paramarasmius palmivorus TaxID=297713 RepID=A0AAW0CSM3_9AGAR